MERAKEELAKLATAFMQFEIKRPYGKNISGVWMLRERAR